MMLKIIAVLNGINGWHAGVALIAYSDTHSKLSTPHQYSYKWLEDCMFGGAG